MKNDSTMVSNTKKTTKSETTMTTNIGTLIRFLPLLLLLLLLGPAAHNKAKCLSCVDGFTVNPPNYHYHYNTIKNEGCWREKTSNNFQSRTASTPILFQSNPNSKSDNNESDKKEFDQEEENNGTFMTNQDLLQKDYEKKVADAQAALAAVEKARQNMQQNLVPLQQEQSYSQSSSSSSPPPPILRSTVSESDAGTLLIEIPPLGMSSGAVFNGAFSIAWFSAIVPATLSGAGLFMIPFWMAGGLVAKQAVVDPFLSSTITIGQYGWTVETKYGKLGKLKTTDGPTEGVTGARAEIVAYVNNVPQCELRLFGKGGSTTTIPIGANLEMPELEYLADRINQHLKKVRSMPDLLPPLP